MNDTIKNFNLSDGTFIRYKVFGKGKPLILFHTFRNRLEYSENVAEFLKNKFTIYLIDLPGFGDSPINRNTNYDQDFFTNSILSPLNQLASGDENPCFFALIISFGIYFFMTFLKILFP